MRITAWTEGLQLRDGHLTRVDHLQHGPLSQLSHDPVHAVNADVRGTGEAAGRVAVARIGAADRSGLDLEVIDADMGAIGDLGLGVGSLSLHVQGVERQRLLDPLDDQRSSLRHHPVNFPAAVPGKGNRGRSEEDRSLPGFPIHSALHPLQGQGWSRCRIVHRGEYKRIARLRPAPAFSHGRTAADDTATRGESEQVGVAAEVERSREAVVPYRRFLSCGYSR